MKKVTWQQFIRMNTRKRIVLMFGSMFLALVVVTGAVFALAQYSGGKTACTFSILGRSRWNPRMMVRHFRMMEVR